MNVFSYADSYTSDDIILKWNVSKVDVGNKHMAQFDYEGAELSSDMGAFSTGELKQNKNRFFILSINRSIDRVFTHYTLRSMSYAERQFSW